MKVEVYRNLHNGKLSVRKAHGKVLRHTNEVYMKNVSFVVQPAGRERVRRERKKYVHAFLRGEEIEQGDFLVDNYISKSVFYNPYTVDNFSHESYNGEIEAVYKADFVYVNSNGKMYAFIRRPEIPHSLIEENE